MRRLVRELAEELLRHYSPTFSEGEAVEALKRFCLDNLSFDEVYVDRVGNLIARYGSGPLRVALIGHIDTVPGELPVKVEGDIIRGRGAVDAKGPLASAFIGAHLSRSFVSSSDVTVYAIAAVGEEGPSHGAWELVNSGFRVDVAVICEPSRASDVVIEYRGSALVRLACKAPGAHAAVPWSVESACDKVIKAWLKVRELSSKYGVVVALTKLVCGESSNVTPRSGEALISVRIPVGVGEGEVRELIEESLPTNCSYELSSYLPPVKVSPNSLGVRAMIRALLKLGVKPKLARKYGTSDMNVIYGKVCRDVLSYGPGDPKLAHSDDEYVSLNELELAAKAYAMFIKEVADLMKSSGNKALP